MRYKGIAAAALVAAGLLGFVSPADAGQRTEWRSCPSQAHPDLQCTRVSVPVDWSNPDGEKISLAVNRIPASGQRIGSVLTNPGGPGGSGTASVAMGMFDQPEFAELHRRFDILGLDPRGVGASKPVPGCSAGFGAAERFPVTTAGFDRLRAANRAAGKSCDQRLLAHLDTTSVARDMDAVRAALGEPRINYLGISYGSELGAKYAELFPGRVRTMVLDGIVDHGRSLRSDVLLGARAHEQSFYRFARWCTDNCRTRDVPAALRTLTGRAAAGQLHAGNRTVSEAAVREGLYSGLTVRAGWPALDKALAAAESGDASALVGANGSADPAYAQPYRAVGCQDFGTFLRGPGDVRAMRAALRAIAPNTWRYSEWWDWASGCVGWPAPVGNPPSPARIHTSAPILLANGLHDPATPYAFAMGVRARIDNSALLTYHGDGHSLLLNSACGRAKETRYLITGTPSAREDQCPASS